MLRAVTSWLWGVALSFRFQNFGQFETPCFFFLKHEVADNIAYQLGRAF